SGSRRHRRGYHIPGWASLARSRSFRAHDWSLPCAINPSACRRGARMKRVILTAVLAMVFVTALLLPAWSQRADRPRRVGVLFSGLPSDLSTRPVLQALVDGLREHGWEEGRNVVLEVRYAGPDPARFPELAAELDTLKVDVIMTANGEAI